MIAYIEDDHIYIKLFIKLWSAALYSCQNMTSHGVILLKVTNLYSSKSNSQLIWTICGFISRVQLLWKLVEKVNLRTSLWHGWFMIHLTKDYVCNRSHHQSQTDLFKYKFFLAVEKLSTWIILILLSLLKRYPISVFMITKKILVYTRFWLKEKTYPISRL